MPGINNINVQDVNPKKVKRAIMRSTEAATQSHTHNNKPILDSIDQSDLDDIAMSSTAIAQIATALNITLDSSGNIISDIRSASILPYYLTNNNGDFLVNNAGESLFTKCGC